MRLYIKLILFIISFAGAASSRVRGVAGDLAYDARVRFVLTFGSDAEYEALVDDTQRMLAAKCGSLEMYEGGKRYRKLLAEALADAARRNVTLSDDELARLEAECKRKAFDPVQEAIKGQDGPGLQE